LAETRAHLSRLQDLLAELSTQLASMEPEVERARRYQQVEQEIRDLEKKLRLLRLRHLDGRRAKLLERLNQLSAEREKVWIQAQELEREKNELQSRLEEADQARTSGRSLWEEATARRQEWEIRLESSVRERESGEREETRLKARLNTLQTAWLRNEEEMQAIRAELEALEAERCGLEAEEKVQRAELADLEARWAEALQRERERRAHWHQRWSEWLELQNRWRVATERWQHFRIQGQRLYAERDRLRQEQLQLKTEIRHLQSLVTDADTRVRELQSRLVHFDREMGRGRERLGYLREEAERIRQRWQEGNHRLTVLREWQQNYEGYSQAVKALFSARERLWPDHQGLIGVVAEVLKAPPELEVAIEAALGSALQFVVTRTEADAQRAIAYLKATGSGRVTFLPLDAIRPRRLPVDRSVIGWAGVVGIGSELVSTAKDCGPVAAHLLGDLLIMERLEQALALSRRFGYRIRVVTLEGDLLHPGGSLTGGSLRGRTGRLLSRSREITELALRVEAEGQKFVRLQGEIADLERNLSLQAEEAKHLQEELWQAKSELDTRRRQAQEASERLLDVERKLTVIQAELEQWEEGFREMTSHREQLERDIAGGQPMLPEDPDGAPDVLSREFEARREELLASAAETRGRLANVRQLEERARGRLAGLSEAQARLLKETEGEEAALAQVRARLEAVGQEGDRARSRVQEWRAREQALRQAYLEAEARYRETEAALRGKERALAAALEQQRSLERRLEDMDRERREVDSARKAELELLRELYGWDEQAESPQFNCTEPELRRLLDSKLGEREELGKVDLAVLAEYRRLQDRYRALSEQVADLEAARSACCRAIAEVEKLMEERLGNTLAAVNGHLERLFPALFGGGQAWLDAPAGARLLDGGVELKVRLPGKRIPNLALLSGGEKALAAVAVLFSLLLVKPSPFCLLDEIDASLDEANVRRFADFLRRLAAEQQFIVVSHRASTVEVADTVYGLTMEEEGVSKLVSVRLPGDRQPGKDRNIV
ncbi:MAG: chromosome segregation protein SMC, partial [Moorellales bacterium]